MRIQQLAALLAPAAYPALVLLLLGCGVGLPLSEDVILVASGYLAGRGVTSVVWTFVAAYPSVLAGDLLLYQAGRALGGAAARGRRLRRVFTPARQRFAERLFARWGVLAVAIARQIIGVRSPMFVLAGAAHMPRGRFLVTDALAALVAVPGFVLLGYAGGHAVGAIVEEIHWIELAVLAVAIGGGAIVALVRRRRPRR